MRIIFSKYGAVPRKLFRTHTPRFPLSRITRYFLSSIPKKPVFSRSLFIFGVTGFTTFISYNNFLSHRLAYSESEPYPFNRVAYHKNLHKWLSDFYPDLKQLIVNTLGESSTLFEDIERQLEWCQKNKKFTPQAASLFNPDDPEDRWPQHLNREVFRALVRVSWALRLYQCETTDINSLMQAHNLFIANQPKGNKLPLNDFIIMIDQIKSLNLKQLEAVLRATVVASVPLSADARYHADKHNINYPIDSIKFSHATVSDGNLTRVYPIASRDVSINGMIESCFPLAHWRHGVLMENYSSLANLQRFAETASSEQLNEFIVYWMINSIGMNGHKDMRGAQYCTRTFIWRVRELNNILVKIHGNPSKYDLQTEYVTSCLNAFHVPISKNSELNMFSMALLSAVDGFDKATIQQLSTSINETPKKYTQLAALTTTNFASKEVTYVPGVMTNAKKILAWSECLEFYGWMQKVIASSDKNYLSFFRIGVAEIQQVKNCGFSLGNVTVTDDGTVTICDPPSPGNSPSVR